MSQNNRQNNGLQNSRDYNEYYSDSKDMRNSQQDSVGNSQKNSRNRRSQNARNKNQENRYDNNNF